MNGLSTSCWIEGQSRGRMFIRNGLKHLGDERTIGLLDSYIASLKLWL